MIKSMTGFATLTREDDHAVIGVTVRSVNHRYLDVQIRIPQALSDRESALRACVQRFVSRGRVELALSLEPRQPAVPQVDLNEGFITALESALERARARGVIAGHLAPGDLLRLPHALTIREQPADATEADTAALDTAIEKAVEQALGDLNRMRAHEGAHLHADLRARRAFLADVIERLAGAASDGQRGLEARLADRVRELTSELQIDQTAIAQEVVRVAARSDISEEVTRFRSHLAHWDTLAGSSEPCGRKLDFLLQEMNREINTIGSKADGQAVSELVVSAKAELEKMREQVQNVE
jgi:uncharacterized protein (TIGR00255 family)